MKIIEIGCPNLPREARAFRLENRFVAYTNPAQPGVPTTYPEAIQEANALGSKGCVGFLVDEPVQAPVDVKVDWSVPVPSVLSRRKRAAVPDVP